MIRLGELHKKVLLEALQLRASLALDDYRDVLLANPDAIELPMHQLQRDHVLVAVERDLSIGFAALELGDKGSAELDGLFVEPSRWGEGIGRQLLDAAVNLASDKAVEVLTVITSERARGFYEKCGFSEVGLAATRFGPAVAMSKRL